MSLPLPLPDTERVIGWEELPERARAIPDQYDPTALGVLMVHQSDWLRLINDPEVNIALCVKGRRTGITFATALSDAITAATTKADGGDNVWYMADTREKGLEYIGYCAKFSQVIARGQATAIEQHIFYDQRPDGTSKEITAWRVRYASGHRITALSSRAENIHGLQGLVDLDEAALHRDVGHVLESAAALLIWGGRIRVWSSHRGVQNPFNELYKDIQAGLYGPKARSVRITFDDAVANGLYERICWMSGKVPDEAGKRDWYQSVRAAYGPRTAAMREELDAIPRDGNGISIPGVWIDRAMPETRPVLRLHCSDDFAARPERERQAWCQEWIERELSPVLPLLGAGHRAALGMDFARHRHFSVLIPADILPDLSRRVPWLVELANVPTRQQEQILWAILDYLKARRIRWMAAIDASGPGQTLAEYTADRYGAADPADPSRGGRVLQTTLSTKWYGEWMRPWVDSFADGTATYPRDASLEADFRAVEDVGGIPRVPQTERKDIKEPDLYRHGDGAIAAALMWFASLHQGHGPIEWTPVLPSTDPTDHDHPQERGLW